jgi:hypothetical protein
MEGFTAVLKTTCGGRHCDCNRFEQTRLGNFYSRDKASSSSCSAIVPLGIRNV